MPIQNHIEQMEEVALTIEAFHEEELIPSNPSVHPTKKSAEILVADDEPVNLQVLMN